ncbi:hypothetical protein SAMN05216359_11710 [Roseateles sp. YR242]|uniref:hypothetical protein n=1 Tax=Roseateles sp. YR242 TaxID=1855305 RepID=UPI0008B52285|nr:hypothetical protein [Roseateles sp. YR242]SEL78766.1 hypothetical protein SAMN05216359_11710 [Roseateles sp. YR242]
MSKRAWGRQRPVMALCLVAAAWAGVSASASASTPAEAIAPAETGTAATSEAAIGCQRLRVALDPKVTAEIVERDWGTGADRVGANARLELVGCDGKVVDQLPLESSLAQLDTTPVRGAPRPTYLVSADLTQEAGSYNGPLTTAVEVEAGRLKVATARTAQGKTVPLRLALTGKAAWKRAQGKGGEELWSVSSQPAGDGFKTTYARFFVKGKAWVATFRTKPELWESDGEFPSDAEFTGQAGR